MPIYEYRCLECSHQQDHLQKISEEPLSVCPSCGKPTYKKMLSAAGFQLKGSGWYATDFRNAGSKPAEKTSYSKTDSKAEKKSDAKTDSKSDAKSDSKSDTKTDSKPDSKAASSSSVATD
jgi:putative FmdB family regulatory protein